VTVRLIATDLDGTLVRSDGEISSRTRDALAAAEDAGLIVVFVTGRPPRWMQTISDETGHRGLAVCANGAVVYDLHTETVVQSFPMDIEVARGIAAVIRDVVPDVAFAVETGEHYGHEPHYRSKFELPPDVIVAHLDELIDRPVLKLLARHTTMSTADLLDATHEVVGELAMLTTATFSETDSLLEISAPGVTKAFGLERLAAQHGVDAAGVVAFGDMPNDIPMLVWAGHAVAVANAHPDVIDVADEVTSSNDEDGVALVIERVLRSNVTS
jgi:Cof subfamily protein (haloacid dehalogenase superfamily)